MVAEQNNADQNVKYKFNYDKLIESEKKKAQYRLKAEADVFKATQRPINQADNFDIEESQLLNDIKNTSQEELLKRSIIDKLYFSNESRQILETACEIIVGKIEDKNLLQFINVQLGKNLKSILKKEGNDVELILWAKIKKEDPDILNKYKERINSRKNPGSDKANNSSKIENKKDGKRLNIINLLIIVIAALVVIILGCFLALWFLNNNNNNNGNGDGPLNENGVTTTENISPASDSEDKDKDEDEDEDDSIA